MRSPGFHYAIKQQYYNSPTVPSGNSNIVRGGPHDLTVLRVSMVAAKSGRAHVLVGPHFSVVATGSGGERSPLS